MRNEILLSTILFSILFLAYSLIPLYEKEDGTFKFLLFQDNKYWHDGISPLMLAYFKNYVENKSLAINESTIIDQNYKIKISNYADVFCVDGLCYPNFFNFGLYVFFKFSFWLNKLVELNFSRFLIITNLLIYSSCLVLLFLTLNEIYARKIYLNLLVTLVVGLGTSFAIFSKYLFLHNSFQIFFFILFLYFLVKLERKKRLTNLFLSFISFLFFSSFFQALPAVVLLIFLSFFLVTFYRQYLKKGPIKLLIFFLLLLIIVNFFVFLNFIRLLPQSGKTLIIESNFVYNVYDQTFFAVDLKPNSITYSISNELGNAVFLKTYSLFGYFFGPKGIFVNSPFLLFSFFGMISFKSRGLRNKLLILLAFMILFVAYINPDFEGGFTPRYVRHSEPIIVIFSIFFVNFLTSKKKFNKSILFLLTFLIIISSLNSISLSIRSDWNYVNITDLISYDTVLWPWLSFKEQYVTLDLTKVSEQSKWNLTWEEGCNPPLTEPRFGTSGIETGPCACTFKNNATREIIIPKNVNALQISVCSRFSGNDGTVGIIYIDGSELSKFFINSSTCGEFILNISKYADGATHKITLESRRNSLCYEEVLIWKAVKLFNFTQKFPAYEFDALNEIEKWNLSSESCQAQFSFEEGIMMDYCSCTKPSFANYNFITYVKNISLKIEACTVFAGGDGAIGQIFIDDKLIDEIFIKSNECTTITKNIETTVGEHRLTLKPKIFGVCNAEIIKWKKIVISE
ncbi:MAG: hypothetical protein QXO40_02305 [Candidatus Aenigmatarchaeota archaeon]